MVAWYVGAVLRGVRFRVDGRRVQCWLMGFPCWSAVVVLRCACWLARSVFVRGFFCLVRVRVALCVFVLRCVCVTRLVFSSDL